MGMRRKSYDSHDNISFLCLIGGLVVFNSVMLISEKIFMNGRESEMPRPLMCHKIEQRDTDCELLSPSSPSTPRAYIGGMTSFRSRIEQTKANWYSYANTTLDWNEWARTNLQEARDICIEADYFFGNSNVLPRDWSDVVEKWEKIGVCGDAELDDGTYQPVILDASEKGITTPS